MRLALLSDLHANRQALDACLSHARSEGADNFAFLGDLVGYGADPVGVLDQVMALQAQGAWVLQGNHDAMAVMPPTGDVSLGASSAAWTHAQLNEAQRHFLAHLPLTETVDHVLLVHASADKPEAWRYVDGERAARVCLDAAKAVGLVGVFAPSHRLAEFYGLWNAAAWLSAAILVARKVRWRQPPSSSNWPRMASAPP